jgi:hypothetical protein
MGLRKISFALLTLVVATAAAQDAKEIARKVLPSVVLINTQDSLGRDLAIGSGFFVREDVVATNYHVIRGAASAKVHVANSDSNLAVSGIVAADLPHDLVLLKVEKARGVPLPMADLTQIDIGESIYVFGSPVGLEGSMSNGIVSSRGTRQIGGEDLLQITAPISPGSSGGPVVNGRGEVVGVAVASLTRGQNLNFAVPVPYLTLLIANIKFPTGLTSAEIGSVTARGYKHFAKDGLIFDYPEGWTLTDESNSDAQQLTLNRPDSDALIKLFAHRGKTNTTDRLLQAKAKIIDPYVSYTEKQFVAMGAKPQRAPAITQIGGTPAEGIRITAVLDGEPGEAGIYWAAVGERLVVLTLFGPEKALTKAVPMWDAVRNSLKIEAPAPKASPSPKSN